MISFYADHFNDYDQESLRKKVEDELESYRRVELAAGMIAGRLYEMKYGVDPDIDINETEIVISQETIEVSWYDSDGDLISQTFPISHLWDFDWEESKLRADMEATIERARKRKEELDRKKELDLEHRRFQYEELKKEFGDD